MGEGILVITYKVHGGSCRVDHWNEVMTGRRGRKMDGVDEGKGGGIAAAVAAAGRECCCSLKLDVEFKVVWGAAYIVSV